MKKNLQMKKKTTNEEKKPQMKKKNTNEEKTHK